MYKRILVPLDGSQRTERAIPHAQHLAASSVSEGVLHNSEVPVVLAHAE